MKYYLTAFIVMLMFSFLQGSNLLETLSQKYEKNCHINSSLKEGHILVTKCKTKDNKWILAAMDLNQCIGQEKGELKWIKNGNFYSKSKRCSISLGKMYCDVEKPDGTKQLAIIDLNEKLSNENGVLVCKNNPTARTMPPEPKRGQIISHGVVIVPKAPKPVKKELISEILKLKKKHIEDDVLYQGQRLTSKNRKYVVFMHKSGNLSLYEIAKKKLIWSTNTRNKGKGPYRAVLHGNGNFAVKDVQDTILWETKSFEKQGGVGPWKIIIHNNGNFALYDNSKKVPFWSTNTGTKEPASSTE